MFLGNQYYSLASTIYIMNPLEYVVIAICLCSNKYNIKQLNKLYINNIKLIEMYIL